MSMPSTSPSRRFVFSSGLFLGGVIAGSRSRPDEEQGSNGGMASDGALPGIDAALDLPEGYGSRNREAWAPVLLEMAGVPTLGSDGHDETAV